MKLKSLRCDKVTEAVLLSCLMLFSSFLVTADAVAPSQKVTFISPFGTHNPGMVAVYAAEGLGFFRSEGLDLSIELSKGTGDAAVLLAAGKGDFALTSPDAVMILASKNATVVSFLTYFQEDLNKLVVLDDSPIKNTVDLVGKTVGVPFLGAAGHYVLLRELTVSGIKEESVAVVAVGLGSGAVESLIQRKVDALMTPSYGTVMYTFQSRGIKARLLSLKGKPIPTLVLAATSSTLRSQREVSVKVARAIAKGIVYTMANPSVAVTVMGKLYPELGGDRGSVEFNTKYLNTQYISEEGKKNLIGWNNPDVWLDAKNLYQTVGLIPGSVVAQNCYSNELLAEINNFDKGNIERMAQAGVTEIAERTFWDMAWPILLASALLVLVAIAVFVILKRTRSRTSS